MQVKATTPRSKCCNATALAPFAWRTFDSLRTAAANQLVSARSHRPRLVGQLFAVKLVTFQCMRRSQAAGLIVGRRKDRNMLKMARYTALAAALIAGPATLCLAQAGGGGGAAGGTSGTSGGAGGAGSMGAGSVGSGTGAGMGGTGTSGSTTTGTRGSTLSGNNSGSSGAAGTGPNTSGGSTGTGSTSR
jgi:hypothetical protein